MLRIILSRLHLYRENTYGIMVINQEIDLPFDLLS